MRRNYFFSRGVARRNRRTASAGVFFSSFSATENPLSEGGQWINGGPAGWNNVKVTANGAVGASDTFYLTARYLDDIAHVDSTTRDFNADQFVQATVYRAAGYVSNGGSHEIELLLRFSISSGDAHGYEVLLGTGPSGQPYYAFVRWNGGAGNYTPLVDPGWGSLDSFPADGDVVRAQIVGTILSLTINEELIDSFDVSTGAGADNVWTDGQPGIGFWPVDGAIAENLGWKDFVAGDL